MIRVFLSHPPSQRAAYYGDRAVAALRRVASIRFNPDEADLDPERLTALAGDCDVIVSYRRTAGDAALFDALPNLKAFVRCAIDIRNVDLDAAGRHGVLVTQASAGFVASVAEWIVGAMIDLARHVSASVGHYRAGRDAPPLMGRELRGSTVGIVGYGRIARYFGTLASAFGMDVVVHDPHATVDGPGPRRVGFDALLGMSDFVVCLAAATAATENLMDARAFARMKRDAYFVNAARGDLVDEAALIDALDAGRIAGCALDVGRAPDQMPSPRVAAHPKVIATPHVGGLTPPAVEHQAMETVAQVADLVRGRVPAGAVNAEAAFRWRGAYASAS
ncbi:hydroxyacid dehydrogenase [Variovorax sp. PvP013]|uniref:hydroxyacid dehydrogenase n=1 Tax=Variovorax sp. PvP013 TaxID=3156435 RepID=UPI003D19359A